MLTESPEVPLTTRPDRVVMVVPGLPAEDAAKVARSATLIARSHVPKMSGAAARSLEPIYADGMFGIYFGEPYVWFQDHGIRPFTMKNLAGKTIPMWIKDPTGSERAKNPKAKTRTTAAGVVEVLIFRRAAQKGQRMLRTTSKGGKSIVKSVSRSYPGAPGRISRRQGPSSAIKGVSDGGTPGRIAMGNIGVRWRHPGIAPRLFLNHSLLMVAQRAGLPVVRVYACDLGTMPRRYQ